MIPPRAYTIRPRTFRLTGQQTPFCARCSDDVPCEHSAYYPDMAALLEACREHELGRHSTTVTWTEFRKGWVATTVSPEYLRSLTGGNAVPIRRDAAPTVRRRVRYEWLADSGTRRFGLPPVAVTVREPQSLAAWLGPERAATELLAA